MPASAGVPHPPLLEAIVADALDPAYADATARRSERPPRTRTATAVLLLVGGLAVGLTVGQERSAAPSAEQARSALVTDARQRTGIVNALGDQIRQLRNETTALQAAELNGTREGRQLAQQRTDLSAATAETAVTGPGLEVTVDDAPGAGGATGSAEQRPDGTLVAGTVQDRDLQSVVNALWAAGAEAVSVGGIRLSPLTAIRTAGETILADYRPLTAPYTIDVVGDPGSLARRFRTTGATLLAGLGGQGIRVDVTQRAALSLPAASGSDSRLARPVPAATPTPTPSRPTTATTSGERP
jgi:uncharacterized protein YlxW (UPF0749 family)